MNSNRQSQTRQWLRCPILPVVVIDSVNEGLAIAQGLLDGGINQIEITLRTPAALAAMRAIGREFPHMALSAGTVITPEQFNQACDAGATLFISPGFTEALASHAESKGFNWVPGVATASEMLRALELDFDVVKFFPAVAAGGPKALEGLTAPLPSLKVIPTGGVRANELYPWKKLPCVAAVGGTWLTNDLDRKGNIAKEVEQRTRNALAAWQEA